MYATKVDFGYGDWSIIRHNLSEVDAVVWFNAENGTEFTTAKQCMDFAYDYDPTYTIVDEPAEENDDWMSS